MLPQGSQVSIRVARGSVGLLWSHDRGMRSQFAWKGESQGVSRGAAGSLGSPSCHGDLRKPLILFLESQDSFGVLRGLSGFHSSWCRGLESHVEVRPETQGSSSVLTWISGSLWRFHWGVRHCLVLRHGTALPSRGVKRVSGLLLS